MDKKEHQKEEKKSKGNGEQHIEDSKKKKKKEAEIEELENVIEERDATIKKLQDDMLYLQADFENFKKIKAREKQDLLQYGNERLIKEILPVIDNLERALDHAPQAEDAQGIGKGVELTLNELLKVLEKSGVTRVDAIGKPFDPTFHEAYCQEERDDVEPDTVISEFQKGYLLNGRLLRPSVVSISKQSEKS